MIEYLQLQNKEPLPKLKASRPYRAVVIIEMDVSTEWQAQVSDWLVKTGCLYMLAWGKECSSWDDSIDNANIEQFNSKKIPDESNVLTTWHDDELLEEVFWFAKYSAFHDYINYDKADTLRLHISEKNREEEYLELYRTTRA